MVYPIDILYLHHTIIFKSSHRIMNKGLVVGAFILLLFSCTKESPQTDNKGQDIPANEFQALKKEVNDLKATVESLTGNQEQSVSKSEFDALKQENEALKAQIESLTSGFFEIDGLRFDKNGNLISTPVLGNEIKEVLSQYNTYVTERKLDAEGRLSETKSYYVGGVSTMNWEKKIYEYNGKTCRITTQISEYGLPAGTPYWEYITETTYW